VTERDALINELHVSTGLAGRSRRLGDPAERARKAVSARMHDCHRPDRAPATPRSAATFVRSVVMGRSCRYQPERRRALGRPPERIWQLIWRLWDENRSGETPMPDYTAITASQQQVWSQRRLLQGRHSFRAPPR